MQGVLLPHEIQLLMHHEHHKPNFVLAVLTQVVDNLPTTDARKQAMDHSLTKFHQAVGSCERMIKTPIPRSYTRLVLNGLPSCLSLALLMGTSLRSAVLRTLLFLLFRALPLAFALVPSVYLFCPSLPHLLPFFSPPPDIPLPVPLSLPLCCCPFATPFLRCPIYRLCATLLTILPGSADYS